MVQFVFREKKRYTNSLIAAMERDSNMSMDLAAHILKKYLMEKHIVVFPVPLPPLCAGKKRQLGTYRQTTVAVV